MCQHFTYTQPIQYAATAEQQRSNSGYRQCNQDDQVLQYVLQCTRKIGIQVALLSIIHDVCTYTERTEFLYNKVFVIICARCMSWPDLWPHMKARPRAIGNPIQRMTFFLCIASLVFVTMPYMVSTVHYIVDCKKTQRNKKRRRTADGSSNVRMKSGKRHGMYACCSLNPT